MVEYDEGEILAPYVRQIARWGTIEMAPELLLEDPWVDEALPASSWYDLEPIE